MLTVLGGLAEFERELIRARTGEGRERARARGVRFGRPPAHSSSPQTNFYQTEQDARSDPIYLRVALLALAGALVGTAWALCERWQGAQ
jgi:DNA invertase Pin-like site-specific DNA recombinase